MTLSSSIVRPPIFDSTELSDALDLLPSSAWALPVSVGDVVNPGYQFASLVQAGRVKPAASLFGFVLDVFGPVFTAWVAKVPAGGFIGLHVDEGPYHERWHVPLVVAGTFDGSVCEVGVSFPVSHWLPHRVDNPTGVDRVHLVVDRDVWVDVPVAPFQRIKENV